MKSRILNLAGDTLTYGFFILIGRFLTFLLTPFYTNFLTIEEVGDIGNFFALIAFVNVLYAIGMDTAFLRFYSKDNLEETRKVFTLSYFSILVLSLTSTLLLLFLSPIFAHYLTKLPEKETIVQLAILVPFTDCLMVIPYGYLRMTRQVAKFSIIRLSLIVIAVALNILFVVILRIGIKGVFYAQLLANVIGVLFFIPILLRQLAFHFDGQLLKKMLEFGLPTVPAAFSGIILQVVDRPILKFLTDANQVGIYMVNYRLAIPMMLFVAMYDYAWKPFYLSNFESSDAKDLFSRIFTYFVYSVATIFLVTSFYIEFLVQLPFFGGKFIEPSYWVGMDIIPIIMLGYVFNGFYVNFTAGITIQKTTKYLPVAVGISALLKIILNFVTIPYIGYYGSAWATLLAYLSSAVIVYYFSQKVYPIRYNWGKVILLATIATAIYFLFKFASFGVDDLWKFIIRTVGIFAFVTIPFLTNIFNYNERNVLKSLFKEFTIWKSKL
ncbi:MAG: oligosaccharide flippase family protein [Ignavibacteria bacterium]|nr:oligosaccharide flippase family protein [Ignavibacteria bacterium]